MFSGVENVYFSGWGLTTTGQCGKNLLYQEGRTSKWYMRTNKIVLWYMSESLQKKKSKSFVGIHHLDSSYYFSLL